jgi:3-oxo-5-alpha-steroid 4-dehydrogenase 3
MPVPVPAPAHAIDALAVLDALLEQNVGLVLPTVQTYWLLAIAAASVALLPSWEGIDWFRNAVIVSACRGKLTEGYPERALGPLSDVFVPQKWFAHFYVVGCLSNALVLAVVSRDAEPHAAVPCLSPAELLLWSFQVHLVRRLVETVWVMRYPKRATMHVMAYAFGMSYYIIVPLTYYCAYVAYVASGDAVVPTALTYVGLAVFAAGSLVQWHAHYLLASLGSKNTKRAEAYVIPRGGLFSLVSCPHYFGEVVIYLGLAVMGATMGAAGRENVASPWYPFVWVVVNLSLGARMTHQWYLAHFASYERLGRRALVPYLF